MESPLAASAVRRVLLQVPRRKAVFDAVSMLPGTHARRISRDTGIALGVVEHHIRQLERHGLIFAVEGRRRRTLYVTEHVPAEDAEDLHVLRRPHWADLLRQLMEGEPMGVQGLAGAIGISPSTASYHLRTMKADGVVERVRVGRESIYVVKEPQRWTHLLGDAPAHGLAALAKRAQQHEAIVMFR